MAIYSIKATKKKRVSQQRIHCRQKENLNVLSFCFECWGRSGGNKSAGWVFFFLLKQVRNPLEESSAQSVLVVRLLLARAGDAVLGLGWARAQAVQSPTILCVVNVVFKEELNEIEQKISVRLLLWNTPAILVCDQINKKWTDGNWCVFPYIKNIFPSAQPLDICVTLPLSSWKKPCR